MTTDVRPPAPAGRQTPPTDTPIRYKEPSIDCALDLIVILLRWSRSHLSGILLVIMATLLVLFGPTINAWAQQRIGSLNFVFRTLLFVLIYVAGYGLAMVFVALWLAKGFSHFSNYTLAPMLLLAFFAVGVIVDRS